MNSRVLNFVLLVTSFQKIDSFKNGVAGKNAKVWDKLKDETTWWLQGRKKEVTRIQWLKVHCPLIVALQYWCSWTLSKKKPLSFCCVILFFYSLKLVPSVESQSFDVHSASGFQEIWNFSILKNETCNNVIFCGVICFSKRKRNWKN